MTKHTPGPWQCVGPNQEATHIVAMPPDATKAGLPVAWAVAQHERGEGPANARLIAAAPELLAACKAQHNAIDTLFARLIEADPTFMPSKSGVCWDACLAGNAAIAKATEE